MFSKPYTVQLPVYNGPLDLLLELIEQAELDITKVALAQVTEQYISYFKEVTEHHLEDLTSFLVIASRLLQIKSEALLPRPPNLEPDSEDIGDALARQLIAYKKYKQVAVFLSDRLQSGLKSYLRIAAAPMSEPKLDLAGATLDDLQQAMIDAIASIPNEPDIAGIIGQPKIRMRDRIKKILEMLQKNSKTTFQALLVDTRSRLEIVISLLALLELIKQHQVTAEQKSLFGDIELTRGDSWQDSQEFDFELEFEE